MPRMGGAMCKHERVTTKKVCSERKEGLWKYIVEKVECDDCPETFRRERRVGRVTKATWNQSKIDQRTCSHMKHYTIGNNSIKTVQKETNGGLVLRFFMGAGMDGIQYKQYWQAVATCDRCDFKFQVQSDFEEVWKNKKQVKIATGWKYVIGSTPPYSPYSRAE